MSDTPGPRTRPTRLAENASTDRSRLHELLDSEIVCHVGLIDDGHPVVLPTAMARHGEEVFVHGSTGSRWMRALAGGAPASVAVTALDAVVVARSTFESSLRYRSAVLFGTFTELHGQRHADAVAVLSDRLIPGRRSEVRPSTAKELAATMVLAMPLERWSLKISEGWPEDPDTDLAGPAWAGVVPLSRVAGEPQPAPDLRPGIAVPPSVRLLAGPGRVIGAPPS